MWIFLNRCIFPCICIEIPVSIPHTFWMHGGGPSVTYGVGTGQACYTIGQRCKTIQPLSQLFDPNTTLFWLKLRIVATWCFVMVFIFLYYTFSFSKSIIAFRPLFCQIRLVAVLLRSLLLTRYNFSSLRFTLGHYSVG